MARSTPAAAGGLRLGEKPRGSGQPGAGPGSEGSGSPGDLSPPPGDLATPEIWLPRRSSGIWLRRRSEVRSGGGLKPGEPGFDMGVCVCPAPARSQPPTSARTLPTSLRCVASACAAYRLPSRRRAGRPWLPGDRAARRRRACDTSRSRRLFRRRLTVRRRLERRRALLRLPIAGGQSRAAHRWC